jgi:hypothetical protein
MLGESCPAHMRHGTQNPSLYECLVGYVRQHAINEASKEQYTRFSCDDFCGVNYQISYHKQASSDEGTIAVRMTWPWQLSAQLKLAQVMPELISDGPPGLELSNASSRSAIVTWLLETTDGVTDTTLLVASWLSCLRCILSFLMRSAPFS